MNIENQKEQKPNGQVPAKRFSIKWIIFLIIIILAVIFISFYNHFRFCYYKSILEDMTKSTLSRQRAAEVLGELRFQKAYEPLMKATSDKDPKVRKSAISGLINLRDKKANPLILKALNDEDPKVKACAAWGLGIIKGFESLEPLIKALDDKDKEVRKNVLFALDNLTGKNLDFSRIYDDEMTLKDEWKEWFEENREYLFWNEKGNFVDIDLDRKVNEETRKRFLSSYNELKKVLGYEGEKDKAYMEWLKSKVKNFEEATLERFKLGFEIEKTEDIIKAEKILDKWWQENNNMFLYKKD